MCLIPLAAIFGVADALISSAERLATTPSSERSSFIIISLDAGFARANRFRIWSPTRLL